MENGRSRVSERLMRAAESIQACSRIIREESVSSGCDGRSSTAWDHYIRGTWPIEETSKPITRYVPQQDVAALVRQLNESGMKISRCPL
jgi:hypothetical protein